MPEAKRILLLGGQSDKQEDREAAGTFLERFGKAMEGLDSVRLMQCFYDELALRLDRDTFTVTERRNLTELKTYDLVVFKGAISHSYMAAAISRYLRRHRVDFLNDYGTYKSLNKLEQLVDLQAARLPLPPTLYIENHELMADIVEQEWNFPLVLKAVNGSKGRYNYLIHSPDELKRTLGRHPGRNFLVQTYIENDCDYRVLIVGGEVLVLRRQSLDGGHVHNTSQGGRIEVVPIKTLPAEVIEASKKLADELGMEVAGVDVIQDKHTGRYYFLELNSQPAVGQPAARPLLRKLLQQKINLKSKK